jgi:hypothetical protein
MTARTYDNFDILIESLDENVFRARVTNCTAGDTPAMRFSLPFSALELENLLLKLNPAAAGTRRILDPHAQASTELGGGLFDAVFREDILLAWIRSADNAREQQHGLRLRLRLSDAPSLAGLPWELLYDRKNRRFFAQSDRTPVVRYLDVSHPPRPLAVRGPLNILVVISSPQDLPPLDVEHEWLQIHEVLAEQERTGRVVVNRLPYPSLSELQKWLRRYEVHVLHFVGHGDFDGRTGDGLLAFCSPLGRSSPVTSVQLGAHVRDHDPLRLVVLNACRTATTDNMDAFSGMAQGLIQQEAAAVVAMQFPISDGAAIAFTTEFYGAMADGEPVDQALASARKALLTDFGQEWATPVLFLRAADGRIFDQIMPRTPAPAMPKAPVWDLEQTTPIPRITESPPTRSAVVARRPPPPEATPPASPPPLKGRRPTRRRRAILIAAAAVAVAAVIAFALPHRPTHGVRPPGGQSSISKTSTRPQLSSSGTSTGPSSSSSSPSPNHSATSSRTLCPKGGSLQLGEYWLTCGQPVQTWSGPSSTAYKLIGTMKPNSSVQLICAVYGEPMPLPDSSKAPDALWYWTNHSWINDYFIETGGTRNPQTAQCSGTVLKPAAGVVGPSRQKGPFATLGIQEIPVKDGPRSDANTVDYLRPDLLEPIICHTAGTDLVRAAPGGTASKDWDKIKSEPERWVANADLLTPTSDSPADPC